MLVGKDVGLAGAAGTGNAPGSGICHTVTEGMRKDPPAVTVPHPVEERNPLPAIPTQHPGEDDPPLKPLSFLLYHISPVIPKIDHHVPLSNPMSPTQL